ncbi:MAG TPA: serine/threonine-protein kinase [Gemmatales bacterium]|nr:serine/threonine-protein kinase [Gemmatales bacterium]
MASQPGSSNSSSEAFLTLLRKSLLIEESKLDEAIASLQDITNADPKDIAQAFINMGLLTRFQVRLLLQGKWRGFFIAGKYRLLDMIGEGGMGKVYLCEHKRMQRLVAIKVLPVRLANDEAARERFDREARAIASLNHMNIVQAYDIDSHDGMHYIVMEFVDGVSLQALVALRGPLTVARAVNYLGQAAEGLQHGHEMGLVHRDIKPANLLLGRDGTIKVLDYGLARFFDNRGDDFTRRHEGNSIIGTADYLAPEQAIDCSDVDVRADLYALGCTSYYLLTGQPPFGKDIPTHTKLLMHQSKDPAPLRELRPDLDPGLCDVIRKMIVKEPAQRYQQPKEVVEALRPWLNQPVAPPTDDEIPLRDALTASRAMTGNSTAKIGTSSSVATKTRGRSVTIMFDKSKEQMPGLMKRQLPPWIWTGIGGIVAGLAFLLWPRGNEEKPALSTTQPVTIRSAAAKADAPIMQISKGNTLEATGVQRYMLEIEAGGALAPRGVVILDRGMKLSRDSLLNMEPDAMIHVKDGSLEVSGAQLKFAIKYEPKNNFVCLIRNHSGQSATGSFAGAAQSQTIRSSDGKWQGKISYEGDADSSSPSGGRDVVLYQVERVH